jgi:protein-S-isoprenylcysteine O-methyltransferase Ste14
MLKATGYLISTLSVLLLGIVSWQSTADDHEMRWLLVAGMVAAALGMLCRWLSFRLDERPASAARPARSPVRRHAH